MGATRIAVIGGRRVACSEHGDPRGRAVFFLHGTPDSSAGKQYLGPPAAARRLRVLCPDRPGIGSSDPLPGRTIAGSARELLALADAVGAGEFAVVGYSAGAPYALAAAAGCGPRLSSAALLAGAGPLDRPGARAGLAPGDLHLLDLARDHPRLGAALLRAERLGTRLHPALALAPPGGAGAGRRAAAAFVEALRPGPHGVLTDYRLWGEPWGLDWAAITAPVHLFHGDRDRIVPLHHAEDLLARLPTGELTVVPGAGHLSITSRIGEVFDVL